MPLKGTDFHELQWSLSMTTLEYVSKKPHEESSTVLLLYALEDRLFLLHVKESKVTYNSFDSLSLSLEHMNQCKINRSYIAF